MSKKSFADVMASEKNGPRRIKERVWFSSDLAEEYAALSIEFVEAKKVEDDAAAALDPETRNTSRRLAEKSKSVQILQRMEALVGDNSDAWYDVEFQQMERADWLKLRGACPPRDAVADDRGLFNAETFPGYAVAASLVDPEPTQDVLDYFRTSLSNGEWERLANVIWNLNEGVRSIPKGEAELISLLLAGS